MDKQKTWMFLAAAIVLGVALTLLLRWAASPDELPVAVPVAAPPPPVYEPPIVEDVPELAPVAADRSDRRLKTYEDLPQKVKQLPWASSVPLEDYKLTPFYKLHVKCGFPTRGAMNAYEVSEFASMSRETQRVVADTFGHGSQGCANWHVSVQYAAQSNHNGAKYHGLLSSLILDSPVPLMTMMGNYYRDTESRDILYPYALYAIERWPGTPSVAGWDRYIDQTSREKYADKVAEIRVFAARLEEEEIPQHDR